MRNVDYIGIIHKYINPNSYTYLIYMVHVVLVTAKALKAARKIGLTEAQLKFIEEAAMLHDIGIINVQAPEIGCVGTLPYICHGPEGRKILEDEGLWEHARIAENHIGAGLTKEEIIERQLPLPPRDMVPESIEEKIICWADLFFSKTPEKLWWEKSVEKVQKKVAKYGTRASQIFDEWQRLFEG